MQKTLLKLYFGMVELNWRVFWRFLYSWKINIILVSKHTIMQNIFQELIVFLATSCRCAINVSQYPCRKMHLQFISRFFFVYIWFYKVMFRIWNKKNYLILLYYKIFYKRKIAFYLLCIRKLRTPITST